MNIKNKFTTSKIRSPRTFFPDLNRLNPDLSRYKCTETEAHLAKCGMLYLEDRPTDISGGEAFSYIKKELFSIFNPREIDGPAIGISDSPILLYINSCGCPINDGMALYDQIIFMRKEYNLKIHTIAQGFALSGGALVLQAGTKRLATSNSIIMIHGLQTEYGSGTMKQLETEVEALRKMNSQLVKVWAQKMSMKPRDLEDQLNSGDKYFTAREALKAGLIDDII